MTERFLRTDDGAIRPFAVEKPDIPIGGAARTSKLPEIMEGDLVGIGANPR